MDEQPEQPTLTELVARETDPKLRTVLECYAAAETSLELAATLLGAIGRERWQLACASRARDVAWQAQRYMRQLRTDSSDERLSQIEANGGSSADGPEVNTTLEAVLQPRVPSPAVLWCVRIVVIAFAAFCLWLIYRAK